MNAPVMEVHKSIIASFAAAGVILVFTGGLGTFIGWPLLFAVVTAWSWTPSFGVVAHVVSEHQLKIDVVMLTSLSVALVLPMWLGQRPISHDHTVHFARVLLFEEALLNGQVHSWTNRWFAGYPLGYFYPAGADLYVIAIKYLCAGLISTEHAYALAVASFFLARNLMVYYLGVRLISRPVGLVGALLCLLDSGAPRAGGWLYSIWGGVWHQDFSLIFSMLAIPLVIDCLRNPTWRVQIGLALVTSAALMSHPVQLIFLPATTVLVIGIYALHEHSGGLLRRITPVFKSSVIGVMLASFWLVPFVLLREYATRNTLNKIGLTDEPEMLFRLMGKELATASLYQTQLGLISAAGFFGAVMAYTARRIGPIIVGTMVFFGLLVGCDFFKSQLHLPLGFVFDHVIFLRLAMHVKPFWYLSAAIPVVFLIERNLLPLLDSFKHRRSATGSVASVALVIGLAFPVAATTFSYMHETYSKNFSNLNPFNSYTSKKDRTELASWLRENPGRIGLLDKYHALTDVVAASGRAFVKLNYMPATEFKYKTYGLSEDFLAAHNVDYVITNNRALTGAYLRVVTIIGGIRVYKFLAARADPYWVLQGNPQILNYRGSDEEIAFDVQPGQSATLLLPLSPFPNWAVEKDGLAYEHSYGTPKGVGEGRFMKLGVSEGRFRIFFAKGLVEWSGYLLTLLGLLCLVLHLPWSGKLKKMIVRQ